MTPQAQLMYEFMHTHIHLIILYTLLSRATIIE